MKKIFTLILALAAFALGSSAQTLFLEDFDSGVLPAGWTTIDNDGDGHNWDAHTGLTGYQSQFCIGSASYDLLDGALTPDNWLITPAIQLTQNAALSFYVKGQDPYYFSEKFSVYISATGTNISDFTTELMFDSTTNIFAQRTIDLSAYTGQTVHIAFRHHNCTDYYWFLLDHVLVFAQPTVPTIDVVTHDVDFGTVAYPGLEMADLNVDGYLLSGNITVTAASPFQVSADGHNYATTVSLPSAGGKLYMRCLPTAAAGNISGTITLSSPGATNTILNATAFVKDCDNFPLPYYFEFDNADMAECWTVVDANHDAENGYAEIIISPDDGFAVYGFSPTNAADDWLISPSFTIGANAGAKFEYSATALPSGVIYPEKFEVYAIPEGQTYENGVLLVNPVDVDSEAWLTQLVKLTPYVGQKIQIGIHVISDADAFVFGVRHFSVENGIVGVEEYENVANIFPNPANNIVNVETASNIHDVVVYNLAGQLVGSYSADGTRMNINVSNLTNGLYFMRITTDNGVINQKFNVAR